MYLEDPFSPALGDAALASLEQLLSLYLAGYPAEFSAYPSERMGTINRAVNRLEPTYRDLTSPDLLTRLDPEKNITAKELDAFLQEHVPRRALLTFIKVADWLAKHANGRLDWPGTQRILELAEAHWRQLPYEVGEYLVSCAGQTNHRRAFPLMRAYVEDLTIPEINRSTVRFVGSMIENPIDPRIFDIPKDQDEGG